MNILLLAAALLTALPACQAAQRRAVHVQLHELGGNMNGLTAHLSMDHMSSLIPTDEAPTAKGDLRLRIKQSYGGLEVVGASADVEVTREGVMRGAVSGVLAFNLQNDIPDPRACTRTVDEIMTSSKHYLRTHQGLSLDDSTPVENLRVFKKVDFEGADEPAKLIYEVDFFFDLSATPYRPYLQLDACDPDLRVIRYVNKIKTVRLALRERRQAEQYDTTPTRILNALTDACPSSAPAQGFGGNRKVGQITYGQDEPYCLRTEVSGDTCTMTSRYASVIDLKNTRSSSGRSTVEFNCTQGYSDPVNEAYGVAHDAFYYGDSTGAMYEQWYGFWALGYTPELRVHYEFCHEDAFWNGVDLTFGDGCFSFYPMVCQDLVAHELGHGITDRFSDLYYEGQSGGINEAFSDMSGEVAELFSTGDNDWQAGAQIFKRRNQALRYFETPSRDGSSINSANDYRSGMNVHYSSGVFNRAFFQLVTVQGIPLRRAYEIFLQANRVIWSQYTNFQEGACGAMKAAYDLGYDVMKVKNAFAVVDIDLASCNYEEFEQTIAYGETRKNVLVSSIRNPIFALETGADAATVGVIGTIVPVTVSVTSDSAGSNVVVSGNAPFTFVKTSQRNYFKLSTTEVDDITIDVTLYSMG